MATNLEYTIVNEVTKVKKAQNLVFGWASQITEAGSDELITDSDGDQIEPVELESAVYDYVRFYGWANERHEEWAGWLVESIVFTKEKMEMLGMPTDALPQGWWVGFYIPNDEVFEKVASGEYKMFSIGGRAVGVEEED